LPAQDLTRGLGIERAVEGDDAAERRGRIGRVSALIGGTDMLGNRDAAGVGVLDDDAGRRGERLHALQRGIGIAQVVVAQRLAGQHARPGHRAQRGAGVGLHVQGAVLMRVFAVTQWRGQLQGQVQAVRPRFGLIRIARTRRQPLRNLAVVTAGVGVRLGGERAALCRFGAAGTQRSEQPRIVIGIDHHAHPRMVLGRRAQHRRTADVDVFDRLVVTAIGSRHGCRERIQVDHQQVDGSDSVLGHHRIVDTGTAQQPAVNRRVQGLDPAVHDLRKTRRRADIGDDDSRRTQRHRGAASGQQFNAQGDQRLRQLDQTGLVGNGKQGAADGLANG